MQQIMKTLVHEFFSITGRPVSTLTVEEYVTMKQYSLSIGKELKLEEAGCSYCTKDVEVDSVRGQNESKKGNPSVVPMPVTPTQNAKENAMMMLKSIKG